MPTRTSIKQPAGASDSELEAGVPERAQGASRTVLFVTYYYPPSGGPGVQRSLKFTRYLSDFGWRPLVVTVDPQYAAYPARDETLLEEVPEAIPVRRTKSWDPYAAYAALTGRTKNDSVGVGFMGEAEPGWKERLGRWVRANIFLPDARAGWVPYAVAECRRVLKEHTVDAVYTTGPPHSTHLVGYWMSSRLKLPWLADFRDPWTGIDYASLLPSSRLARRIDGLLERKVLSAADVVTAVSPAMGATLAKSVGREYPIIYNGFDPADFDQTGVEVDRGRFVIAHVGSINEARNPVALWQALASLGADSLRGLVVRLVGNVDPTVLADVARYGLDAHVEHVPYLAHSDAVAQMQRSALLLLVINRVAGAEGILTGKVFEYIGSGRPILAVGPSDGDAARLLADACAGEIHCFECASELAETISRHYNAWKERMPLSGATPERAANYSRVRQAGQLAAQLDSAVAARSRRNFM